nr:hydroxyacid dehydrogenase [Nitrospinaceae bacterium]NIR53418.1 hydroxyacid dehydrogenase [Nitrospinaceae bacterium]NIS83817.1 hydroxyacid dehydrogenase [Nitrospinaceae bacterium]NIT80613.1 hydroxyacid dehydrogenase [Nitrospinaceae bacterium]NIU42937.1 hydroxyacid dehydrogenase [Nitrospinaceae bacterium]
GHWLKDGGAQLTGKTVGIVGCGRVGEEVVRLLAPFECRILIRDIVDKSKFCLETGASEVSFEELIETADLVSLHVPLTPLTRNLVDEITLHRMKPAAYLVNTARGEVVDPEALKRALQQGRIAGAALDVFAGEPPEDRELLALPNLLATPHIGGNTVEAVEAMGRAAIDHLVQFFQSTREPEAG